jgi:hypothetical protein
VAHLHNVELRAQLLGLLCHHVPAIPSSTIVDDSKVMSWP